MPANITDIRSWFGLITQVSYAFAASPVMAPFKHLLSGKIPFAWSDELETAFIASKEEIVNQCEKGIRNFRPNAPTALATDWSKLGMGCWLTQKFCNCPGEPKPGCCLSGWQTIFVASPFNTPAESKYHPIEGEACASAWALDKCRMFVLGHPNLILVVDHKPLLAILGLGQDLSVLTPRLLNFKQKSMAYRFKPIHIPEKIHVVPDTITRRHDSPITKLPKPATTPPPSNNVLPEYKDVLAPPGWVSQPVLSAVLPLNVPAPANDPDALLLGNAMANLASLSPEGETARNASIKHDDNVCVLTCTAAYTRPYLSSRLTPSKIGIYIFNLTTNTDTASQH